MVCCNMLPETSDMKLLRDDTRKPRDIHYTQHLREGIVRTGGQVSEVCVKVEASGSLFAMASMS